MALRIRTNIPSLGAQRNLNQSVLAVQSSMEKLSSGKRINKAADDAAGLAVSEKLRAKIHSLKMAERNTSDGISMVQTAEGGLIETSSMLVRLRELAVQAASDTIGIQEREFLDKEYLQLKDEIDRIAQSTEFNGTRLLLGQASQNPELMSNSNPFPLEIQVSSDYYKDSDAYDERNPVNIIKIDFSTINSLTSGDGSLELGTYTDGTRVHEKEKAQNSIHTLDEAINKVNNYRAYFGSIQNRLNSAMTNLGVQIENLTESQSRIADTDFASQTAELTSANILQQAGTAILANANSQPNVALSLLGS